LGTEIKQTILFFPLTPLFQLQIFPRKRTQITGSSIYPTYLPLTLSLCIGKTSLSYKLSSSNNLCIIERTWGTKPKILNYHSMDVLCWEYWISSTALCSLSTKYL